MICLTKAEVESSRSEDAWKRLGVPSEHFGRVDKFVPGDYLKAGPAGEISSSHILFISVLP